VLDGHSGSRFRHQLLFDVVLTFLFCTSQPHSQLAMINIHSRLAALSQSHLSTTTTNTTNHHAHNTGSGGGGSGGAANKAPVLNFRRPRSHPGGGLYKQLDDVRPVLQVF